MDIRTLAQRADPTPARSATDENGYLAERSRIDLRTRVLTHAVTLGLAGFFAVLFAMPRGR
ncbi:MAG: hypothetical protein JWO46_2527 [Nocardioidaceae bacterium]|nr:hypothetical protein [Nocardioidaceae bacterium]